MENSVALFLNGAPVYWHSIVIALAVLAALACASFLRAGQDSAPSDVWIVALAGFLPSMLIGRIYYCHFAQESFSDASEMYRLGAGGYALYGVMAGYLLTAVIFCKLTKKQLAPLLDAAAPAAALGIAIGRAASFFSGDDFGAAITNPELQRLPYAVYSESRGEWNLAVFSFEAISALVIFAVLMLLYLCRDSKAFCFRNGDIMLMFMFLYGIPQTVFESMRNDSLFLISLGFVRISQVISILMSTAVFAVFSIRSAKRGVTHLHVLGWFFCLTRIALAFWMEFCITAETAVRNYTIMSLCLMFYLFVGLALYFDGNAVEDETEERAALAVSRQENSYFSETPAPASAQADERCTDPESIRCDIAIRTHNILCEPSDYGFAPGSPGRYMVRIRPGTPGPRVAAAYPVISRAVINVRSGQVHLQDLFDLMGFELDCVSDYTADVPAGFYHVTMCVLYPASDNTADPRNIYIYFHPQHSGALYSCADDPCPDSSAHDHEQPAEPRQNRSRFNAH